MIRRDGLGCFADMQSASLLVFPFDARAGLVRQVALELASLHGEAANAFWRKTARDLYGQLLGSGQDDARAREDVSRFSAAVQAELCSGIEPTLSLVTA